MRKRAYNFTLEEAYAFMKLPYGASSEEVKNQYRLLSVKYHPDLGGDEEMMKKLNRAKEVIDAQSSRPSEEDIETDYVEWEDWSEYQRSVKPEPSKIWIDSDIEELSRFIIENGLRQVVNWLRWKTFPSTYFEDGKFTYKSIPGFRDDSRRMPIGITVEELSHKLRKFLRGIIIDIKMEHNEAWLIQELFNDRGYSAISFELPRSSRRTDASGIMRQEEIREYMYDNDFDRIDSARLVYWGPRGRKKGAGVFISDSIMGNTFGLVERVVKLGGYYRGKRVTDLEDVFIEEELPYMAITTEILDRWMEYVRANA